MSKKLSLAVIIFLGSFSIFAQDLKQKKEYNQTEKGNYFIGGSGNFTLRTSFEDTSSSIVFMSLKGGRFIKNNFALGTSINSFYRWGRFSTNAHETNLNVFARKYFGKSKLKPFTELGAGVSYYGSRLRNRQTFESFSDSSFGLNLDLNAGLSYFVSDNLSIDMEVDFLEFFDDNLVTKIGFSFFF